MQRAGPISLLSLISKTVPLAALSLFLAPLPEYSPLLKLRKFLCHVIQAENNGKYL